MKNIFLCGAILILFSFNVNASEKKFEFRVSSIESPPVGCSQTVTNVLDSNVSKFIYVEHHSKIHKLFSDKSTSIEFYDPENILTKCNNQAAWRKYSDYIPSNNVKVVTLGANCIFRKKGSVTFAFTQGFYEIIDGEHKFDSKLVSTDLEQLYSGENTKIDIGKIGFGKLGYPTGKICFTIMSK